MNAQRIQFGSVTLMLLAAAAGGCDQRLPFSGQRDEAKATVEKVDAIPPPAEPAPSAEEKAERAPQAGGIDAGQFRALRDDLSEKESPFPAQGLISNETTYLQVASQLPAASAQGVYLGVGPEQNFSYIALVKPKRAYIIDVRRDNALLHLLYKAAFDVAESRPHFLALVTGREWPKGTPAAERAGVDEILDSVAKLPASEAGYQRTHGELVGRIDKTYGIALSSGDLDALERMHRGLFTSALETRYGGLSGPCGGGVDPCGAQLAVRPRFRDLLAARDPADGQQKSFLAREESFRFVQELERQNAVIPVIGDIAGDSAMASLAKHLRDEKLKVTVFYVSNVEQFLRQRGAWEPLRHNVGALPLDDRAVLVRTHYGATTANPCQQQGACGALLPATPGMPNGTSIQPLAAFALAPPSGHTSLLER